MPPRKTRLTDQEEEIRESDQRKRKPIGGEHEQNGEVLGKENTSAQRGQGTL